MLSSTSTRSFTHCALGAFLLLLAACGGDPRKGAAEDVHRFMTAVADDDRALFEILIDRPAVRDDLRRQIVEIGKAEGLEVEGGPSDFALDRMISPVTLRLIESGEGRVEPPSVDILARALKRLDDHTVCLPPVGQPDRCLLTFARRGRDGFQLTAMQAAAPAPITPSPDAAAPATPSDGFQD